MSIHAVLDLFEHAAGAVHEHWQTGRLRFEHGEMTQSELAEKIGMTRQTVAALEAGKYSPSLEAAFRIAGVFGKPLDEVFRWDAGGTPQTPPTRRAPS